MKKNNGKSFVSFTLFTIVILALGFVLLHEWSTVSAGYVDKINREICLYSGKGGEVCFPVNTCGGRCLLNPGTSGGAIDPAGDLDKSFGDLMDSFFVKISDGNGTSLEKNFKVCFNTPGKFYVHGFVDQSWTPVETVLDEASGKYCAMINAGDAGVPVELSFAYFK